MKMEQITQEARLLAQHRIDTAQQLSSYKDNLEMKIETLTAERKQLYRRQRTVAVKSDEVLLSKVKAEISSLSKELSALRQEVRLCDDIAVRSGVIKETMKTVRENSNSKGKENEHHEQLRRRSRTDRQD